MKSVVYIYDRLYSNGMYNPDNQNRYDQKNEQVKLANEIRDAFPTKSFITYCGYPDNPNVVGIDFTYPLTDNEMEILDNIYNNHVNNIPEKYIVLYNDDFIRDPANQEQAYMFDTEEAANQFIANDHLTGASVRGIVVLNLG